LLCPAGDPECVRAAVAAGADAVYFGLSARPLSLRERGDSSPASCFNARARAKNIPLGELARLVAWLHRHGVKGYVTLNTLVFSSELEEWEHVLRQVAESGADAVLVQDLGAARFAREVCPDLPLHASTQMSLTSAEGIRAVESLGIERVILARELSIDDIRTIRRQTRLALEVFVHGALCISYSGQCLASRTLGERSANRGDCAQACRLPYQLVCDGEPGGAPSYLLSPLDLAAYALVPELIRAGVAALKIEGRLKSPEYVAAVTRHYRRAIDAAMAGQSPQYSPEEMRQLEATFSRGFSLGWLQGSNPKALVTGLSSAKRGVPLGEVKRVLRGRVEVALSTPVKRGDGVVFEAMRAEEGDQGGRIYGVYVRGRPAAEPVASGVVELTFARGAIDWDKVRPGQIVRKTDDPALLREIRKTYARSKPGRKRGQVQFAGTARDQPSVGARLRTNWTCPLFRLRRRVALDLMVEAAVGQPLRVSGRAGSGASCEVESEDPLVEAVKHPLSEAVLREQLGRLGDTPYELRRLEAKIVGRPMVPLSVLGKVRHAMIAQLDASVMLPPRPLAPEPQVQRMRATIAGPKPQFPVAQPPSAVLGGGTAERGAATAEGGCATGHVLCRSPKQLDAALDAGVRSVVAEYRDMAAYGDAVRTARNRGAEIFLATPRIQRPGETWVFEAIARHAPDGVLAQNPDALAFFAGEGLPVVADFSLNAANELTVAWLREQGALRVTASYDLSRAQLFDLLAVVPPEWLEVAIHLHVPMFHTQHCLWCGGDQTGGRDAVHPPGHSTHVAPACPGCLVGELYQGRRSSGVG